MTQTKSISKKLEFKRSDQVFLSMTTAVGAMAPDNMLTMMRKANPGTKGNKRQLEDFLLISSFADFYYQPAPRLNTTHYEDYLRLRLRTTVLYRRSLNHTYLLLLKLLILLTPLPHFPLYLCGR